MVTPLEAYAVLFVNTNAVLALPVSRQRLQSIAGRHSQFLQSLHGIKLIELPDYNMPQNLWTLLPGSLDAEAPLVSYIVQASSLDQALSAIQNVGGEITHELGIINAVGARLTSEQRITLDADQQIRIYQNRKASVASLVDPYKSSEQAASSNSVELEYGEVVGSNSVHDDGIDGLGVTVAVIDTGLWWSQNAISRNSQNQDRVLVRYDAIADEFVHKNTQGSSNDGSGHGTHISGIALHSKSHAGRFIGIAPGADLVSVKAFGADGSGTYLDVIRALDFVVAFQQDYGIGVLNLSFSASPRSTATSSAAPTAASTSTWIWLESSTT